MKKFNRLFEKPEKPVKKPKGDEPEVETQDDGHPPPPPTNP